MPLETGLVRLYFVNQFHSKSWQMKQIYDRLMMCSDEVCVLQQSARFLCETAFPCCRWLRHCLLRFNAYLFSMRVKQLTSEEKLEQIMRLYINKSTNERTLNPSFADAIYGKTATNSQPKRTINAVNYCLRWTPTQTTSNKCAECCGANMRCWTKSNIQSASRESVLNVSGDDGVCVRRACDSRSRLSGEWKQTE